MSNKFSSFFFFFEINSLSLKNTQIIGFIKNKKKTCVCSSVKEAQEIFHKKKKRTKQTKIECKKMLKKKNEKKFLTNVRNKAIKIKIIMKCLKKWKRFWEKLSSKRLRRHKAVFSIVNKQINKQLDKQTNNKLII